jgi:hypothetical protein
MRMGRCVAQAGAGPVSQSDPEPLPVMQQLYS